MSANELASAASPYLLQHQHNPVHWKEWGDQALAEARRSGKPILLSVGYAACHWCHVMAQESFEDAATAEVMNALFVNIKVDREERPDVDHFFMSALQSLGERGGWPLTMFLTPEGAPFWGGTYFPKQAQFGRPSFISVLKSVAATYRQKPETIRRNTKAILDAVTSMGPDDESSDHLDGALLDAAARQVAAAMDPVDGGLRGAPKFPNAPLLELLLRGAVRLSDPSMMDHLLRTLRHIAQGGIYDHLGGGFARYSTDARWLVPHFEKMLYDNAQLIDLLALAYAATGEHLFKDRIAETVTWLSREMLVDGAFAASLDADSDHVEGKFYIWTRDDIVAALGQDAPLFCRAYDVMPDGNWHDEHTEQAVTILNRLDQTVFTPEEEARLASSRARLLDLRAKRQRPALDDKILADWNGLTIAALAHASGLCDEPAWLDLAQRTFAAVVDRMGVGLDGLIHARRGEAGAGGAAYASDYAALAGAALALAEARVDEPAAAREYVEAARRWLGRLDAHYAGPAGVLFMTTDETNGLPARLAPLTDEATPNANGTYAAALRRMAAITGEQGFLDRADRLFEGARGSVLRAPLGHCALLNALDLRLNGVDVVLAGPNTHALSAMARRVPHLTRVLTSTDLQAETPVTRAQIDAAGEGAAFLCQGETCSPPLRDPARLRDMLGFAG